MKAWISATEAAKRLQVAPRTFRKVALAGAIRSRKLPGTGLGLVQYHADDVARIGRDAINDPASGQAGQAVA